MLLKFSVQEAMGIEYLIHSYPDFVTVDSIPLESNSALDKVKLIAKKKMYYCYFISFFVVCCCFVLPD